MALLASRAPAVVANPGSTGEIVASVPLQSPALDTLSFDPHAAWRHRLAHRVPELAADWIKNFDVRFSEIERETQTEVVVQPKTSLRDSRLPRLLDAVWECIQGETVSLLVAPPEASEDNLFSAAMDPAGLESRPEQPAAPPDPKPGVVLQSDALIADAKRTLPIDVELFTPLHYRIPLRSEHLDILVLKVNAPDHKQDSLARWKEDFEDKHRVHVFLEHARVYSRIPQYLERWSHGADLLTRQHHQVVEQSIKNMYGREPRLDRPLEIERNLPDLTALPFHAIDAAATQCREDLLHAEQIDAAGTIRVRVAFIDVTSIAPPGSQADRYAGRIGASIFGSRTEIPTLGRAIAFGPGTFAEHETRPAWVITFDVSPDGTIQSHPIIRANVVNHGNVVPEDVSTDRRLELQLLRRASARAQGARPRTGSIELVESESEGSKIVAQWMMLAKAAVARMMPGAIYRNHAIPTERMKESLARKVRDLGVPATAHSFDSPTDFTGILQALAQRKAHALVNKILSVFLTRSTFDTENHGHYGIRVDAYLDLKPREATGITNQQLLRSLIDPDYPALPPQELQRRAARRNRQARARPALEYRLRFFEQLADRLKLVGRSFTGAVQERGADHLLVDFPNFTKWGVIPKAPEQAPEHVTAELEGFSRRAMRFQFQMMY